MKKHTTQEQQTHEATNTQNNNHINKQTNKQKYIIVIGSETNTKRNSNEHMKQQTHK